MVLMVLTVHVPRVHVVCIYMAVSTHSFLSARELLQPTGPAPVFDYLLAYSCDAVMHGVDTAKVAVGE